MHLESISHLSKLEGRKTLQSCGIRHQIWPKLEIGLPQSALCSFYNPHSTFSTLHSALYTLQCALHILDFTYYLHFTLCTSRPPTLDNSHSILYTSHFILHKNYFAAGTSHSTLFHNYEVFSDHLFRPRARYHTCEHSGSWAASCFALSQPISNDQSGIHAWTICGSSPFEFRGIFLCQCVRGGAGIHETGAPLGRRKNQESSLPHFFTNDSMDMLSWGFKPAQGHFFFSEFVEGYSNRKGL